MDKDTEMQIRELQAIEQNLQSAMMQRQAFALESEEVENALGELGKNNGDVYKIVGNIMMKASKDEILKDLKQKKETIALRLKSLDSQEKTFASEAETIRKKVLSKIKSS